MTRDQALAALTARIDANKKVKRIDNSSLPAGSSMTFYCRTCGDVSDVLPEDYSGIRPSHTCGKCQEMKDKGWL